MTHDTHEIITSTGLHFEVLRSHTYTVKTHGTLFPIELDTPTDSERLFSYLGYECTLDGQPMAIVGIERHTIQTVRRCALLLKPLTYSD